MDGDYPGHAQSEKPNARNDGKESNSACYHSGRIKRTQEESKFINL